MVVEWKEVRSASISFVKAKDLKVPEGKTEVEVLQGRFVEASPSKYKLGKHDFKFELDNGELVVVNAAGNLEASMKKVNIGDYCRISYLGMGTMTKGAFAGKPVHQFKVETPND